MIPKERLVIYIRPNYCTGVAYKVFFHLSLFWWMCHYIDASFAKTHNYDLFLF